MRCTRFIFSLVLVIGVTTAARGDEPTKPADAAAIRALVKELDSDEFPVRQAADEKLAKLGAEAVKALEESSRSESLEVSSRSFNILQRIFKSGDEAGKTAAKSALERFAKIDDPLGNLAKKTLAPPPPVVAYPSTGGVRVMRGGLIGPIAVAAVAKRAMRVDVRDGVKTTEIEEDGKKIRFTETAEKIEGEFSQKEGEKEVAQKFSVKTPDELKKEHPEAFKMFEKAKAGAAVIRIEIGGIAEAVPLEARPVEARAALEEAKKASLKRIDEQIEKIKADTNLSDADREIHLKSLNTIRSRMAEKPKLVDPIEKPDAEKKK